MPKASYLITGIAGTGKSTLKEVFESDGYASYDIDNGFASWINRTTSEVAPYGTCMPMTLKHDWLADIDKIRATQDASEQDTYFFGSAHNLFQHTDIFRTVFLLSYPDEATLRERILHRTGNDYGKRPGELDDIIGYWKAYEQSFIDKGSVVIDCPEPVESIVRIIKRK